MAKKSYKQKIIQNYYDNRESIMLQTLSEIVSELYLAGEERRRGQLWRRAETALGNLKIPPEEIKQILRARDVGALARIVSRQF